MLGSLFWTTVAGHAINGAATIIAALFAGRAWAHSRAVRRELENGDYKPPGPSP